MNRGPPTARSGCPRPSPLSEWRASGYFHHPDVRHVGSPTFHQLNDSSRSRSPTTQTTPASAGLPSRTSLRRPGWLNEAPALSKTSRGDRRGETGPKSRSVQHVPDFTPDTKPSRHRVTPDRQSPPHYSRPTTDTESPRTFKRTIKHSGARRYTATVQIHLEGTATRMAPMAIGEKGWDDSIINDVWSGFREYWTTGKGRSTKRTGWAGTFRNWCRKENYKPSGGRHEHSNRNGPQGWRSKQLEEAKAFFDEQAVHYRDRWLSMQTPEIREIVRAALWPNNPRARTVLTPDGCARTTPTSRGTTPRRRNDAVAVRACLVQSATRQIGTTLLGSQRASGPRSTRTDGGTRPRPALTY